MMVREIVKSGLARALAWTRADALIGLLADSASPTVTLGYHRVVEDFAEEARHTIPAMLISTRMLERQLDWIGRRFQFLPLDELTDGIAGGTLARPAAAVTFDDGYRDVYDHALPLLRRKGIPATVFVVTDLVDTKQPQVHDRVHQVLVHAFERWADAPRRLAERLRTLEVMPGCGPSLEHALLSPLAATRLLLRGLARRDVERAVAALEGELGVDAGEGRGTLPLTWAMLAAMQRAGFTVGSHTRTHAWLTREDPVAVREELMGSRLALEERLGGPVHHFAYPDGRFTAATTEAVAEAGYRFAFTTCTHRDERHPLLTLPRTMLWENACLDAQGRFSPAVMSCQVHGLFSLVRGCDQDHAS